MYVKCVCVCVCLSVCTFVECECVCVCMLNAYVFVPQALPMSRIMSALPLISARKHTATCCRGTKAEHFS